MLKGVYNLYEDGKLVLANVYQEDIREYLGNSTITVANYVNRVCTYRKRYTMTKGDPNLVQTQFEREWNEAVAPFKRVQWVKRGGRKLGGY